MTGEELRADLKYLDTHRLKGDHSDCTTCRVADAARAFLPILERDEKLVERIAKTLFMHFVPAGATHTPFADSKFRQRYEDQARAVLAALIPSDEPSFGQGLLEAGWEGKGKPLKEGDPDAPDDPYLWESGT